MESQFIQKEDEKLVWHCATNHKYDNCSTECLLRSVFDLFGKKYTLLIIRLLLVHKKMRFNELEKEIDGSTKTITQRLRDLEKKGLVSREVFNEIPIRVEYSLTEAGLALDGIFSKISNWIKIWIY